MSNQKLIKIRTDKVKFTKQYLSIMSPLLVKDGLSKDELDLIGLIVKYSEELSVNAKVKKIISIETGKDIKDIDSTIKGLRKKKVINGIRLNDKFAPKFQKDYKLMFYFYE